MCRIANYGNVKRTISKHNKMKFLLVQAKLDNTAIG